METFAVNGRSSTDGLASLVSFTFSLVRSSSRHPYTPSQGLQTHQIASIGRCCCLSIRLDSSTVSSVSTAQPKQVGQPRSHNPAAQTTAQYCIYVSTVPCLARLAHPPPLPRLELDATPSFADRGMYGTRAKHRAPLSAVLSSSYRTGPQFAIREMQMMGG